MSGWLVRHKERIGIALAGHTAKQVEELLLDWLLYGWVSYYFTSHLGPVWGSLATFGAMAPFSAFMCLMYLRLYDWAKLDIFGFEAMKALRQLTNPQAGRMARLLQRAIQLGDIPAFVILSLYSDPFMVTVYLRKEVDQYHGLTRRDWRIFWSSVISSNGYWTLRWTVIIEALRWLWSVHWAALFIQAISWLG